jgi:hypothetical protein
MNADDLTKAQCAAIPNEIGEWSRIFMGSDRRLGLWVTSLANAAATETISPGSDLVWRTPMNGLYG